jgi:sn-glycerol 3-phosphate transport system permease protein
LSARARAGRWRLILVHATLLAAVAVIVFPAYYALAISTQSLAEVTATPPALTPSRHAWANYAAAWTRIGLGRLLVNSFVVAITVACGKIVLAILAAFALVYFEFRGKQAVFWMVLITLMLPVPARIVATYDLIATLGWIDTYTGLTIPLLASATGTFLFRQFYRTVPDELAEAAQLDGAGPMRFLCSFLLPLSWTNIVALFLILFIAAWNQYLWPLLLTRSEEMRTVVIGIDRLIPHGGGQLEEWNVVMAAAMTALAPPVLIILFLQRWFVRGLVEIRE